ncbi:MAG: response regulator [bacterium]|nr:response regulator [bacterium]
MKILVIDDSRAMRTLLAGMLSDLGHEVLQAGDGKEALDVLRASDGVKVCLVDWNMPVMSGYEFVVAVRADARYSALKLMMVTTETEMEQVIRALEAGADEYVMKPFTQDVIVDKLKMMGL